MHPNSNMKRKKRPRRGADDAFIPSERPKSKDDLAELLAEQYLASATSGEEQGEESQNEIVPEEDGGPFVYTRGKVEFAKGVDPSNPPGTLREPLPSPMRGSRT